MFVIHLLLLDELVRSRYMHFASTNLAFVHCVLDIVQALIKAGEAPEQVSTVLIERAVL